MAAKPKPFRGNIFQRFLAAKFLGLSAIIMLLAALVNIAALVLPYWFTVKSETMVAGRLSSQTDTMGLVLYLKESFHGFYDQPGLKELLRVQKASNAHLVPATLKVAQILWLLGTTAGAAACVGLFLVAISHYLHLVAEIALAAALTGSGFCLVLSILLCVASIGAPCSPDNNWCNDMWRDTTVTLESVSWGLFIGIIGAVMTIASAVMLWLQFCRTLRAVEYIRAAPYHPLDDEPEYVRYDYRKTIRPKVDVAAPPPMVTLPQMDDEGGFPGVVLSAPPPQYSPYDPAYVPRSPGSYGAQEVTF